MAALGLCGTTLIGGVNVYGAEFERATPDIVGFGALGAHTAQGRSPTKRSPTGLASGCVWEVMFNDFKYSFSKYNYFCDFLWFQSLFY